MVEYNLFILEYIFREEKKVNLKKNMFKKDSNNFLFMEDIFL